MRTGTLSRSPLTYLFILLSTQVPGTLLADTAVNGTEKFPILILEGELDKHNCFLKPYLLHIQFQVAIRPFNKLKQS